MTPGAWGSVLRDNMTLPHAAAVAAALLLALAASPARAQYPSVPPPPPCYDATSAPRRAAARAPGARTLGIVSFQNVATGGDDAFLGRALAVRVAEQLQATGQLTIVTSQKFGYEAASGPRGAEGVGRALGVRHILAARVGRTQAGEINIEARVRRVTDGVAIWTMTRAVASRDLPALEAEIGRGIVDAVIDRKSDGKVAAARFAGWSEPPSDEAVDHFLRGRYYASLNTTSGYEAALAQYDSAARSDPAFAAGYASSALTIATMLEWGWWNYGPSRVRVLTERGLAATDRALRLDSTSAEAWLARGSLLGFRNPRTYEGVFSAFTRALAYAPRNPEVHHSRGRALMQLGERAAARRELTRALELAPGDAGILFDLAQLDRREGRFSEACMLLDSAIAANPTAAQAYIVRALTRARRGELRFAWADAETGGRLGWPLWGQAASAAIDAMARDTSSARERTDALQKTAAATGDDPAQWTGEYLAIALAASGQANRALDLLERVQPHGARLWFALTDPDLASLHKNKRFRTLLAASRPRR